MHEAYEFDVNRWEEDLAKQHEAEGELRREEYAADEDLAVGLAFSFEIRGAETLVVALRVRTFLVGTRRVRFFS